MDSGISYNKIAYSLVHTLGMQDDHYLLEKIKFDAVGVISMFLRRDLERNPMSRQFLTSLGCIELICVDSGECCGGLLKSYSNVLRTTKKIPPSLRYKSGDSFYYVGTIDGRKSFQEVAFDMVDFTNSDKYTGSLTKYYYIDNYIYVVNQPNPTFGVLKVIDIFPNPQEVSEFINLPDCNCYTDDTNIPLSADLLPLVMQELLKMYSAQRPVEDKEVRINNN